MANRVRPGIEQTRLMSRTLNVRKAEWDLIRGNHQGQRQLRCIKQAGHKTAPDLMSKLQKILAMQEPSTQDIGACITAKLTSGRHVENVAPARRAAHSSPHAGLRRRSVRPVWRRHELGDALDV